MAFIGAGFGFSKLLQGNDNEEILRRLDDLEYCQDENIKKFTQITEALQTFGTKLNQINTKLYEATRQNFRYDECIITTLEAENLSGMT